MTPQRVREGLLKLGQLNLPSSPRQCHAQGLYWVKAGYREEQSTSGSEQGQKVYGEASAA